MTAKQKAKQLVDLFYQLLPLDKYVITTDGELHWEYNDWNQAKKSALIAVDEIVKSEKLNYLFTKEQLSCIEFTSDDMWIHETFVDYWDEVKQEINKL